MGIKVLKKIRRNLRCGTRYSNNNSLGPNNLPRVQFHSTHSENVRVSRDASICRRVESFCKGISFTNRPIKINEKIYLKFVETSTNWSGVLRFGFTSNDPCNIRASSLPRYTCPDMTKKPGNWGKALAERYAQRDYILYFYVNQSGDVYYGVNGEEKGIFFSGVDASQPLWALIDVYGNTMAVEILDASQHLNNRRMMSTSLESESLIRPFAALSAGDDSNLPSQYHSGVQFNSLPFNSVTTGLNIELSQDCCHAMRKPTEFVNGYVFTCRPLQVGETYVVQITKTDNVYVGSLAFGLTSCDPYRVYSRDLPQDPDHLLDRPEYWVVSKDMASSPQRSDELAFTINERGEVRFQKNNLAPVTIMHVDHSLDLWGFFDVYGNTMMIKSLGTYRTSRQPSPNCQRVTLTNSLSVSPCRQQPDLLTGDDGSQDNARNECAVCYEKPIDSVLYTCGHMCMCYNCAVQQWRGEGTGHCPICRAMIRDVIRIYKS